MEEGANFCGLLRISELYQHGFVLVSYKWDIWIQLRFWLATELCFYLSAIANCRVEVNPRILLGFKNGKISVFQTHNFLGLKQTGNWDSQFPFYFNRAIVRNVCNVVLHTSYFKLSPAQSSHSPPSSQIL